MLLLIMLLIKYSCLFLFSMKPAKFL